jgi:prephenate dehydrogenase
MSSSSNEPPFPSIAIVGLGLIGGSIALSVKQRWPQVRIVAVDRQAVIAQGMALGAIDAGNAALSGIDGATLIVLAAPVADNLNYLAEIGATLARPTVVTDVGGTKRAIVDAARTLPAHVTFVGGHPLGGSEKAGLAAARADLFVNRPWVFTPPDDASEASSARGAVEQLRALVEALGAVPATMTADAHDRLMALVSHLPQLTVSTLMDVVGRAAGADGLALAGQGLVDTTRLASSPASVWRDICASNADAIGPALELLIDRLRQVREGLDRGHSIDALFDEAAAWRAELMKGREPS